MTKKEMIIRTMMDFPNLNKWQIAQRVGCHVTYVNQVENRWLKDEPTEQVQQEMFVEEKQVCVQDMNTIDNTLAERGSRYGPFEGHATVTQQLKSYVWIALEERGKVLAPDQQEALDMIFHKIGRIINGDPDYDDSWVDIAGYAKLVADRLRGVSK